MLATRKIYEPVIQHMIKHGHFLDLVMLASTCSELRRVIKPIIANAITELNWEEDVRNATLLNASIFDYRVLFISKVRANPESIFFATATTPSLLQQIVNMADVDLFKGICQILAANQLTKVLRNCKVDYADDCLEPVKLADKACGTTYNNCSYEFISETYGPAQLQHLPFWLLAKMLDPDQTWDAESEPRDELMTDPDKFDITCYTAGNGTTTINVLDSSDIFMFMLAKGNYRNTYAHRDYSHCPDEYRRKHDNNVFCSFFAKAQTKIKTMIEAPASLRA